MPADHPAFGSHHAADRPWREIGLIAVGAVGLAALAGLVPDLHAVRLRIAEAIAYE